jgi:hypothetical protein
MGTRQSAKVFGLSWQIRLILDSHLSGKRGFQLTDDLSQVGEMSDYFSSWRRRAGCGLLLIATILAAGWLRSWIAVDYLRIPIGSYAFSVVSSEGTLHVFFDVEGDRGWHFRTENRPARRTHALISLLIQQAWLESSSEWRVTYVALAVPVTAVSALLILWPQQKRVPGRRAD